MLASSYRMLVIHVWAFLQPMTDEKKPSLRTATALPSTAPPFHSHAYSPILSPHCPMRFVWLAIAFLAFVGTSPTDAQTSIEDILDNPGQYNDTQVSVEGTVDRLVGDGGNYMLKDESDNQIRVRYSSGEDPSEGDQVAIEGDCVD